MSDNFHKKLATLSAQWAEDEKLACEYELNIKQLFAKLFLIQKAGGRGVEEAKQHVEASDEYTEAVRVAIEARYRANLSKRAIKDAETSFSRWQTLQANERFVSKVAP